MAFPPNPEDRPDPMENMPAVRARVPEHVARGEISTGVIVVTGGTEFLLDFVRNLPRPSCVVARVVLPHLVMPQFIDALTTNIDLFRQRYGELPGMPAPSPAVGGNTSNGSANSVGISPGQAANSGSPSDHQDAMEDKDPLGLDAHLNPIQPQEPQQNPSPNAFTPGTPPPNDPAGFPPESHSIDVHAGAPPPQNSGNAAQNVGPRRQNPQDVYDELKLRDEILSGCYANAVMIGHGPFEFSFDFITNFYPQSAVSCRVFMASGHVGRLLDSLKASWEQIRGRYGFPPKP